jgi:phosphotransacetylase
MYQKFQDIVAAAQQRSPKRVIAIAAAADEKMVHVAKTVTDMELCDVILVGDEDVLDVLLAEQGLRPEAVTIVDEKNSDRLGLRAVELVSSGKADILVKGKMNTSDFLRAVLNKEVGLRTGRQLNVLTCYDVPTEPKLFFITDGGMTVAPALADKAEILHNAVPVLHHLSHLPVVADPSHATGYTRYVEPMALAATACGANGLEIEVHDDPSHAWSDGAQALTPDQFDDTMRRIRAIREVVCQETVQE